MSEGEKTDHVARLGRLIGGILPWGALVLAVAGVTLLIVLTGWVLVDFFDVLADPPLNKDGQNDRAAVRNVGLVLAALVAGGFAVWRAEIARRATAAAEAQVKRQQDRDYADLFTKAVEQLGTTREIRSKDDEGNDIYTYKPNIEVRLGAIYALERISQDSERDHIAVMETLCAYVRENAPGAGCEALPVTDVKNDQIREWVRAFPDVRSDVQAVLTVLGRRSKARVRYEIKESPDKSRYVLDLRKANLRKADMRAGNFRNALLSEAHLEGANLYKAHLEGANLREAHLEGADLTRAHLEGANLYTAHLEGADLRGAHLEGADLYKAHLEGAVLRGAHLEGADLREAHLEGADLIQAQLKSAKLAMVRIDSVMASFADFTAAEDLSQEAVKTCFGCAGTVLPEGFHRPAHWHPERLDGWSERRNAYDTWKAARAAGEKPPWVDEAEWSGWGGSAAS